MKPIFLELRHLKTLLALKESGSVSLAAKRIHLTQSALSHQIKLLEDQYDLTLFDKRYKSLQNLQLNVKQHLCVLPLRVNV